MKMRAVTASMVLLLRGMQVILKGVAVMANEGARVLADGIAQRASDIDVIYLTGYGFPAWRGGPMFYADTIGLPKVLARIRQFEARRGGALWSPAALLVRSGEQGTGE